MFSIIPKLLTIENKWKENIKCPYTSWSNSATIKFLKIYAMEEPKRDCIVELGKILGDDILGLKKITSIWKRI